MRRSKDLEGRRIALLAADGFEKIEVSVPLKALKRAGAEVDIISLRHGRIRGVNLHEPAGKLRVTKTIHEADPTEYDGLLIPGGFINPDLLRQSAEVREFVRDFDEADKPIATICHGPWVLISAGVVEGRTLASWPGIRDDVVNAGATWVDQEVVRDGNFVSSRGPQDLKPFVEEMIALFSADVIFDEETDAMTEHLGSDPQHDEPPAAVLKAMKWIPRPSFRTALGVSAIALGVAAVARKRMQQQRDVVLLEHHEVHAVPVPVPVHDTPPPSSI
jgi:protease I